MPRKYGRVRRLSALTALAGAALAVGPGTAAGAKCPELPSTQAFKRWGDTALYTIAPGGRFEGSLSWATFGTPLLTPQNSPFNLSGPGVSSARLRGRDSITSPVICVSAVHPHLRFTARALDKESRLVLEVLWSDKGTYKEEVLEEHPADLWRAWGPSKFIPLGDKLPTGSGEAHQVRLRFTLKDGKGEWLIDDVYIDPRASR